MRDEDNSEAWKLQMNQFRVLSSSSMHTQCGFAAYEKTNTKHENVILSLFIFKSGALLFRWFRFVVFITQKKLFFVSELWVIM